MSFLKFENILLLLCLIIAALCFYLGWPIDKADAHEAPTGWAYPIECCSNQDCREVSADHVREGPDGYELPSGEVVPYYGDPRLRMSPDGRFHWCEIAAHPDFGPHSGNTICFFAPPRAF